MNLREWALPLYTILLQLAVGALLALWLVRTLATRELGRGEMARLVKRPTALVLLTVVVAMLGAHFHLSRPFISYLALRNIGTSWLSREVFFTVLTFSSISALTYLEWFAPAHARLETLLGWIAIAGGLSANVCMSAIYLLPTQPAWNSGATITSFMATTLLLGFVAMAAMLVLDLKFAQAREPEDEAARAAVIQRALQWFAVVAVLAMLVLVVLSFDQIVSLRQGNELAQLSLELLLGPYRPLFVARLGLLLLGVAWLIGAAWATQRTLAATAELLVPTYIACLLVLVGEILGRFLFYATHIRLGI